MARASAQPWEPTPSCRIAVGSCDFSFAERRSRRETYFRKNSSHLNWPNFFRVDLVLTIHDAVFWDVRGNFLCFRQRSDPLIIIIIELFRGWVPFLLPEHELRVEEESAFFRPIAKCPLNRENVKTPPLSGSCERDDSVQ